MSSKFDQNIEIVKTLEKKAPEIMQKIKSIEKEQRKYKNFIKKQAKNRYGYIETRSFSTL